MHSNDSLLPTFLCRYNLYQQDKQYRPVRCTYPSRNMEVLLVLQTIQGATIMQVHKVGFNLIHVCLRPIFIDLEVHMASSGH